MKLNGELAKLILSFKVVPKEPGEVLVQQQLKSWFNTGWCMTPPAGSESKVYRKQKHILWRIAVILTFLWLVGLSTSHLMGGLIHVLLVVAILMVLIRFIQRRRAWLITANKARESTLSSAAVDLADSGDLSRFEGKNGAQASEPVTRYPEPHQSFAANWRRDSAEFALRRTSNTPQINISKCPQRGVNFNNFLYAGVCPHCGEELKHKTRPLLSAPKRDSRKAKRWSVRIFIRLARFVEGLMNGFQTRKPKLSRILTGKFQV